MEGIPIRVTKCESCVFHNLIQTTDGIRHQCNFYHNLAREYGFFAGEKHPSCKVVSIIVNEEL